MTDPLEEALAACTRTIQHLDQQVAACRDANARLTAQLVQTEIQLKAAHEAIRDGQDRADRYMDAMDEARDRNIAYQHEVAELKAELVMRNCRIDELEGLLTQYGP